MVSPIAEYYNDANKIKLLQAAFVGTLLDSVKDDLQKEVALGRPLPNWDSYIMLLTNMAIQIDNTNYRSGSN